MQDRQQSIGSSAAVLPAVLGGAERSGLDCDDLRVPRSATVSVGIPGRTLPMSAINIASARNASGFVRVRGERASADLLLALDHELDPDWRLAVPCPQCADVDEDVRLQSEVPRPKIAPSRSVGSKAGVVHSDSSPAGTTS